MYQLTVSAARDYVRRAMDELVSVEDIGMLVSPDAIDLHKLVEGCIIEAVVKVHSNAPVILIEGKAGLKDVDFETELNDGVITLSMTEETLRIASVKVSDSDYVVTEFIPEDSPLSRMQFDKHIRGVADDPRVVIAKKGNGDHRPVLRYYSTNKQNIYKDKDEAEQKETGLTADQRGDYVIVDIEYVPYPRIEETIVNISPLLEYPVLNEITAMVLDSINEHEKAQLFRAKSLEYMQ